MKNARCRTQVKYALLGTCEDIANHSWRSWCFGLCTILNRYYV